MPDWLITVDEDVWAKLPASRRAEVRKLKPRLAADPFAFGDKVRRELIPRSLGVPNLYRAELREGWRIVYTVRTKDVPPTVRVLLVGSHKTYDRFFGY
jgi:hypothetical protein